MNLKPITAAPTTLITGFLGAGKTTLLNALIAHKAATERWALLINEFGKIGIDGKLISQKDSIAIKEINGGCICCTGQLPLQVALVRLLHDHSPQRLIIEPTGLAHPDELLEQLSQAHWQASLNMQAVLCVLSGMQWREEKCRAQDGYIAHVRHADIVLCNRTDGVDLAALQAWIHEINPQAQVLFIKDSIDAATAHELLTAAHKPRRPTHITPLALVGHLPSQASESSHDAPMPYRYFEAVGAYHIGGWRLPSDWRFDSYELQKWLLSRPDCLRIKGVIHTSEDWLALNITPDSIDIKDHYACDDSRLEMILTASICDDLWQAWDEELVGMASSGPAHDGVDP